MRRRARRTLSPEDRKHWDAVRATATPLHRASEAGHPDDATPRQSPAPEPQMPAARAGPATGPRADPQPPGPAPACVPTMDRRRRDKLRRGRMVPEARLDLHGMTAERAHAALTRFITTAHADGLRLVLVITGKGRPPDTPEPGARGTGVLRHSVPHWLAAPPLTRKVLDVVEAHRRHGGGGALYVYLRRQR